MLASLARPVQVRAGEGATGRSAAVTANRGGPIGQSIGPSPDRHHRAATRILISAPEESAHEDQFALVDGSRAPRAGQSGRRPRNDWTTYGGNDWNQRYSPLKQINTTNVGQLTLRQMFQTGIAKLGSFENTPIVTERRHVRHHAVQHGHGVRSEHRTRSCGATSTSWARRSSAAARTIVVSASMEAPTSTWAPSTPTSWRSTPRPARCSGTRKWPIPPSATASPTHRSSSATT